VDIVGFRAFIFENQLTGNTCSGKKVEVQEKVYLAFMNLEVSCKEEITESLDLLEEYFPEVVDLFNFMTQEEQNCIQNEDFSKVRERLALRG